MTTAIHYTSIKPPDGQTREVFGLQVAISDWLKAYFRYSSTEKFSFLIGDENELREVQNIATQAGIDPQRLIALDRRFPEQNLAQFSTIFRAEPDTRRLLWQRQQTGNFSFCGLAHAISGVEAGEVLQDYCLSPSQASDAIICPSQAVQSAIRNFWDHYSDYLRARFGAQYKCPVQLPVIPLGIECEKFAAKTEPKKRAEQRGKLGIGENDIVLLWVGRLSAAIKAHPLAMFQAAERAARETGAKLHMVMVGYFVPQEADLQFQKLAKAVCKAVNVHFIAANDARFPDGLWAAGDIFLSLIDNMQESFGLTPIEAMAAGLPRVISDWNGYRDSVNDDEDGFLVRTMQPPAGNGLDLTAQIVSGREIYGGLLAKSALTVAVDTDQATEHLIRLIKDKNLRLSMAQKARERAYATYDWKHIIPAYENLWRDLAEKRRTAPQGSVTYNFSLPQLPDPYAMYAAYPTEKLHETNRLSLAMTIDEIRVLWAHEINSYAADVLMTPDEIVSLLSKVGATKEIDIAQIFTAFPQIKKPCIWRTIAWLQKLGIVKNSSCQAS